MKRIRLSRGLFALVDDADYNRLIKHKWSAKPCRSGEIYAVTNLKNGKYWYQKSLHKMILNPPIDKEIMFVNFDGLDCRRSNMRIVDHVEACQHHRVRRDSWTKLKGVSYDPDQDLWSAQLVVDGAPRFLGKFDNAEDAKQAYDEAVKHYFGPHAPLHVPDASHPSARRPPARWIPPPDRKRKNRNPDVLGPLLSADRDEEGTRMEMAV